MGTLTGLFRDLVQSAMTTQRVAHSETLEYYLVHVLEQFARPERRDLLDPPLALDYLEAAQLPAMRRHEKLKRVGDTALFVTGVFADSLERSLVGPEYYARLGRDAYARLSEDNTGSGLSSMFAEIAGRFTEGVRVLMVLSEKELFRREQDTLRLYKRWLNTRGDREADLLIRRGMIPFAPPTNRKH